MNSCCCRSHVDRTDPMACLPSFPRLQRKPCCRPYLEGRSGSCCMSRERRWGQMNGGMIQVLSKMVNQSAGRVCQFLHQLTLQLFARILYPLMNGWNTLKVPFTLPDTCELYYGIFDECGNIRCPIPTRTLLILISMMQYFLNLPSQGVICRRRNCRCKEGNEDSLKDIHNPGYCRNVMPFCGARTPISEPSPDKDIWAGLRRLNYDKYGAGLESFPSDENIPYGYAPHGCPCQRRRGQSSTGARQVSPYAHLSGPLALESACEQELQSPMLAPECRPRSPVERMSPAQVQRYYITNLSDLYSAVTQNEHSRQLLGEDKTLKPRVALCPERRRSAGGFMMMIPQPYFNGMPWSWLHRDPRRMMRFPSVGNQEITPYRSQPMKEEDQGAWKSYENTTSYDQVKPLRENRLLPVLDNTLQAMEPDRSPQDNTLQAMEPFRPQRRLQTVDNFSGEKRSQVPENLPRNIHGYSREVSGSEKFQMQWEDTMLIKVNQVPPQTRQVKIPLDYLRQLKERNQLKVVQSPWSFSKPLSPITRESNYSLPTVEISPYKLERTKSLQLYRDDNQDNSKVEASPYKLERTTPLKRYRANNHDTSLKPVRPNSNKKLWIIRAYRRHNVSSQKTNSHFEIEKEEFENRFKSRKQSSYTKIKQRRTNSVDEVPRLPWENAEHAEHAEPAEDTTEKPYYLDPEEYRKNTYKEHSRRRRHARKIPGESLFFITPATVITSKVHIARPNVAREKAGKSFLDQRTIEKIRTLDNRVPFRFTMPQSSGRLLPSDSEKFNFKIRHSKSTERPIKQYISKPEIGNQIKPLSKLSKRSLPEIAKQIKPSIHNEKLRITERKTHFELERTKKVSRASKSPEQLSRSSKVFLTVGLSTKSLPGSTKSLEINPRNRSSLEALRRSTTQSEIPKKRLSSLY